MRIATLKVRPWRAAFASGAKEGSVRCPVALCQAAARQVLVVWSNRGSARQFAARCVVAAQRVRGGQARQYALVGGRLREYVKAGGGDPVRERDPGAAAELSRGNACAAAAA